MSATGEGEIDKNQTRDQSAHINLVVKRQGMEDVHFNIKRNTELKKLLNAYCQHQSVPMNTFRFLFHERRILGEHTPAELEMEDGDEIDAWLEQIAGGKSNSNRNAVVNGNILRAGRVVCWSFRVGMKSRCLLVLSLLLGSVPVRRNAYDTSIFSNPVYCIGIDPPRHQRIASQVAPIESRLPISNKVNPWLLLHLHVTHGFFFASNGGEGGPNSAHDQEDKKPNDQSAQIILKVIAEDGNEVFFKIKRSTQLKKLMYAYCDRQSVDTDFFAFMFDGRRLLARETPDELEMEDGEEIYAMSLWGARRPAR
ncbi:hypothetical protein ACFE04_031058 [Oxalis oulophora]